MIAPLKFTGHGPAVGTKRPDNVPPIAKSDTAWKLTPPQRLDSRVSHARIPGATDWRRHIGTSAFAAHLSEQIAAGLVVWTEYGGGVWALVRS